MLAFCYLSAVSEVYRIDMYVVFINIRFRKDNRRFAYRPKGKQPPPLRPVVSAGGLPVYGYYYPIEALCPP